MRAMVAMLVVIACAKPQAPARPAPVALTSTQWTERCSARIEIARLAIVRLDRAFDDATLAVDPSPWNPSLRFEARTVKDGYWQGSVSRGKGPCIDFDNGDPEYLNMAWRDASYARAAVVDRIMRVSGDEAWLQANHVSRTSAIAFKREFERAFAACLHDAQSVALVDPPADISCLDEVDQCPTDPIEASDPEDGCPE